jgi:hypothetical protein
MVTVGVVAGVVEWRLASGLLRCPVCSGRLRGGACPGAGDPRGRRDRLAAAPAQVAVRWLRGHACAAAGELPAAAGGRGGSDLGGAGRQGGGAGIPAGRGGPPFSAADLDAFVDEQRTSAEPIGVDRRSAPASMAGLDAYYEEIRPRLRACDEAKQALRLTSHPPVPEGNRVLSWACRR